MEKEKFESQKDERDVANLMKEKNVLVMHGTPLVSEKTMGSFNKAVNSRDLSFEDKLSIIQGAQPTISTSIPSADRYKSGLAFNTGVILGGGKILSARPVDINSTAYGLYKRIPQSTKDHIYDVEARKLSMQKSAIQQSINIDEVRKKDSFDPSWYNEATVESPDIAGLYYAGTDSDSVENSEKEMRTMGKYARKLNLPFYAVMNMDKQIQTYKIEYNEDFSSFEEKLVTPEEILASMPKVSNEQRANALKSLITKGVFTDATSLREAKQRLQDLLEKRQGKEGREASLSE